MTPGLAEVAQNEPKSLREVAQFEPKSLAQ